MASNNDATAGGPWVEVQAPQHHHHHHLKQQQQEATSSHSNLPFGINPNTPVTTVTATAVASDRGTTATTTFDPNVAVEGEAASIPLGLPPPPVINYSGLALIFLAPALGGFLYGYDIGATSFVLSMLRSSRNHDTWWHDMPKWQEGLVVSTLALGALLGSHIVLVYLASSIGRRKEIRISAVLYTVGAACNVMSGTMLAETDRNYNLSWGGKSSHSSSNSSSHGNSYSNNFGIGLLTLLFGRILYGMGVGFIMHGAPTYMAEMSPSQVRGAMVSAKETVIVFGIVVGMIMGDLASDYPDQWTDLYGFSILGAITMLLLTFRIPRSKRWLLMKGYRDEAKRSMQFVYQGNIEDEFDKLTTSIDVQHHNLEPEPSVSEDDDDASLGSLYVEHGHNDASYKRNQKNGNQPTIWAKRYRHLMSIGVFLLVAQQFSGQPSVLAYSRVLFSAAGWQGHASVVTVLIMAVTSAGTVAMVDRLGRKILLGLGCLIMLSALLVLAVSFHGFESGVALDTFRQNAILLAIFVYIAGYQVGYGPVTWTVLSEIYPTEIRGPAMAFSVEVNFLSKFLCQLSFPMIQDRLGWTKTFSLFVCILVISLFFIGTMVPETKGLSLEEIELQLKSMFGQNEAPTAEQNQEAQDASSSSQGGGGGLQIKSFQFLQMRKQRSLGRGSPLLNADHRIEECPSNDPDALAPRTLVRTLSEPPPGAGLPPVV